MFVFVTGWSLRDNNVAHEINDALERIPEDAKNHTDEIDGSSSRMINVLNPYGVHLYIAVDVSRSISNESFTTSQNFIKSLLPKVVYITIVSLRKFMPFFKFMIQATFQLSLTLFHVW